MKNIQLALAVLLIVASTALQAQSKKYKTEGKKCPRVEIIDAGELYSTYELNDGEIEMLKIAGVNEFLLQEIKSLHTEANWPEKLGDLDARIAEPDMIKGYVVYKIADIDDKVVLVVPYKYNKDKASGWAVTKDIYFVMSAKGVK
jgi:hypothetical protein